MCELVSEEHDLRRLSDQYKGIIYSSLFIVLTGFQRASQISLTTIAINTANSTSRWPRRIKNPTPKWRMSIPALHNKNQQDITLKHSVMRPNNRICQREPGETTKQVLREKPRHNDNPTTPRTGMTKGRSVTTNLTPTTLHPPKTLLLPKIHFAVSATNISTRVTENESKPRVDTPIHVSGAYLTPYSISCRTRN